MTQHPDFKGYIHDVGGPTANFRQPACEKQLTARRLPRPAVPVSDAVQESAWPTTRDYVNLLRELRAMPGVKKVFIRSGIRFDYLLADKNDAFLRELVRVPCLRPAQGRAGALLRTAVLRYMGKPRHRGLRTILAANMPALNEEATARSSISCPTSCRSHPRQRRCDEAVELARICPRPRLYARSRCRISILRPATLSTVMYYTGLDPRTMEPVYVPTDPHEKEMQRALIQYRDPKNYALIHEALVKAGRTDLIGYGPKCLIRPRRGEAEKTPHPAQKQPAQKRPAQKRERPAEKKPAAKPRKAQPAAREPHRAERGEAFGKPTAAQLRQAERYLKTRKKKPAVKKPTKPKASGGREV